MTGRYRYPRAAGWRPPRPSSARRCLLCGASPAGLVAVQVGWFRGDDRLLACCDGCRRSRRADLAAALVEAADRA